MNCRVICNLIVCLAAIAAGGPAWAVIIQPDETASKDVFAYQFLATSNWDAGPFAALLAAGKTSDHNTESFLQFDLSSVPYSAAQVTSATLNVFVGDTTTAGFGTNPSGASPAQIDVYAITSTWTEGGLTWATKPTVAGSAEDSASVSAINQWLTLDVTSLVVDWLDVSLANNGLSLTMNAVATVPSTAVVFNSSAGANHPYLNIVPEPASVLLALAALPALAWACIRKVRNRKELT